MKKIIYKEEDFPINSIIIKGDENIFPSNTIFYIKGLLFDPSKENLTRNEIEIGMNKKYIGELNTPIIADNEKVFLHSFFLFDDHEITDLLHILTYNEVSEMVEYIKKDKFVDLSEKKGFFKSLMSNKKDEIFILLKNDNLKQRKIVRIKYEDESQKESFILNLKDWIPYFNEDTDNVNKMLVEMKKAKNKDSKYYPDFYYINGANAFLNDGENKDVLYDEDQKEVDSWLEESKKSEEEANSKDAIDNYPDDTYNRLTGFKYI